jgi:pimeloyl-ACP methyl ester carboxylesterase
VAGLVYIAAFAPDEGESVSTLIKTLPPDAPMPPIVPAEEGFLMLDQAKFAASFAADLPAEKSAFMAASQLHWGVAALVGTITVPAWKAKPSWYLVATDDKMIAPALQQTMADRAGAKKSSTAASHSVYLSKPEQVVALIEQAAKDAAVQAK